MKVRDLQRKEWTGLTSESAVNAGLELLEEPQWLRVVEQDRQSRVIRLNPQLVPGAPPRPTGESVNHGSSNIRTIDGAAAIQLVRRFWMEIWELELDEILSSTARRDGEGQSMRPASDGIRELDESTALRLVRRCGEQLWELELEEILVAEDQRRKGMIVG